MVDASVADGHDAALLDPIMEAIDDPSDTVTGLVAIHALARVPGPLASMELAELVSEGRPGFEEHALWALTARPSTNLLMSPVARAIGRGGLAGMHAQQVLAMWATNSPSLVLNVLEAALSETESPSARRYIAESIGLLPGPDASRVIERVALDPTEDQRVRRTAILAFSERPDGRLPAAFAMLEGPLAEAVGTVRAHRQLLRRGPRLTDHGTGVRVAQVHLGEAGGLATLLPQLGDALAGQQRVAEPLTIVRDGASSFTGADDPAPPDGHPRTGEGGSFNSPWPALVQVEREIRAAFLAGPLPDVVHLRMADPGTYASAKVALDYDIPLIFTLAPDPQGPIAAAEADGTLDRSTFAVQDAYAALWFRSSLVERLATQARELVLFPRAGRREDIEGLTGLDLTSGPPRITVVAEGIDLGSTDRAREAIESADRTAPVLADLDAAIARLPRERQGLPVVVSAGRLVELKGMARLVEAFGSDTSLSARANLVLVGGDLADPTAAEAAELARIQGHFDDHPGLKDRVVLLGQRSHDDVALVLATARAGWGSSIGPGGSYACASVKEEFGLAIVEALAAGLPVTAPITGGPATFVEPGRSGTLVNTTDSGALARAVGETLDLAREPSTAETTRAVVEDRYTLRRMARSLTAVYRVATGASSLGATVAGDKEDAA